MANTQRKSIIQQLKTIAGSNNETLFCILRDLLIMVLLTAFILGFGLVCLSLTSNARNQYYQGQKSMIKAHKADLSANWNKD